MPSYIAAIPTPLSQGFSNGDELAFKEWRRNYS